MRVAVVLTARPSYAKLKPVLAALCARGVDVQLIACASALLERYGAVVNVARKDFPDVPITEVWSTYEGANLLTSAKETGALLVELVGVLSRAQPDVVVVCADRHEVLAAAQAASYLHLPTLHLQGGERTGSIDDKVRDAITALADYHCVCTQAAQYRVYGLTGHWTRIWQTGCPSIDLAKQALLEPPVTAQELGGSGAPIDLAKPFIVVLQHPVTNECEQAAAQMRMTLAGIDGHQAIVMFPGEDAGADAMSKEIRLAQDDVHTIRSLPPSRFLRLLKQGACLVGNSSAGIRESTYLGVPVVDIGSRQYGRETDLKVGNVLRVPYDCRHIEAAIDAQIAHGPYPSSSLYGTGTAGEQIARVICERVGVDTRACGI